MQEGSGARRLAADPSAEVRLIPMMAGIAFILGLVVVSSVATKKRRLPNEWSNHALDADYDEDFGRLGQGGDDDDDGDDGDDEAEQTAAQVFGAGASGNAYPMSSPTHLRHGPRGESGGRGGGGGSGLVTGATSTASLYSAVDTRGGSPLPPPPPYHGEGVASPPAPTAHGSGVGEFGEFADFVRR